MVSLIELVEEVEARSSDMPKSRGTVITHWQTCSMLFMAMQNCKNTKKDLMKKKMEREKKFP